MWAIPPSSTALQANPRRTWRHRHSRRGGGLLLRRNRADDVGRGLGRGVPNQRRRHLAVGARGDPAHAGARRRRDRYASPRSSRWQADAATAPISPPRARSSSLTRTMALDFAADRIRVNAIAPGAIETPMLRRSFARHAEPEQVREASRQPARVEALRHGPMEIAEAALYLASDASSFSDRDNAGRRRRAGCAGMTLHGMRP